LAGTFNLVTMARQTGKRAASLQFAAAALLLLAARGTGAQEQQQQPPAGPPPPPTPAGNDNPVFSPQQPVNAFAWQGSAQPDT
jgi:hypothetical protein